MQEKLPIPTPVGWGVGYIVMYRTGEMGLCLQLGLAIMISKSIYSCNNGNSHSLLQCSYMCLYLLLDLISLFFQSLLHLSPTCSQR